MEQWIAFPPGGNTVGPTPGIKIPGQTITIPAKTVNVTVNGEAVPVPVPAQEIVIPDRIINGLTTTPQVVARQPWPN